MRITPTVNAAADERYFATHRARSYRVRCATPEEVLLMAQHRPDRPIGEGEACYAAVQWSPFPFIALYVGEAGLPTEMPDEYARKVFEHYFARLIGDVVWWA
jgi:hypothetical protein